MDVLVAWVQLLETKLFQSDRDLNKSVEELDKDGAKYCRDQSSVLKMPRRIQS